MNIRIDIQYDGTRYDGWQRQGNTDHTIQGKIEAVLSKMEGKPVEIHGAGRTDSGVHAMGQVANFHLETKRDVEEIRRYLNQYLPEDIDVYKIEQVSERFHSRLHAREKTYLYRIGVEGKKSVFQRKYRYSTDKYLNIEWMKKAAAYCIGTHDFKGFSSIKRTKKSTIRTIYEITINHAEEDIVIVYRGNGFLYNMVRILTGTLIEIGEGKRTPETMLQIIETGDRGLAGPTAPGKGLTLVEVKYGTE